LIDLGFERALEVAVPGEPERQAANDTLFELEAERSSSQETLALEHLGAIGRGSNGDLDRSLNR
jgi:hypothetical protein